jgi:hypothetical protein
MQDNSSTWTLTANSCVTSLIDPTGISGANVTNIIGNGHSVPYDAALAANTYLNGQIYYLVNGGVLTPGQISAAHLASGVYLYRLTAGENRLPKSMVVGKSSLSPP